MAPLHVEEKQVAPAHIPSVGRDAPSGETREIRAGSSDPFHPHKPSQAAVNRGIGGRARLRVLPSVRAILARHMPGR